MDDLTDHFYRLTFENRFRKSLGDGFQSLFEELMSQRHPGDFMPCTPWGNVGDKKNDGFLKSKRTLFQVYAPREMSATEAKKKIGEDFAGALAHWKEKFDHWIFVHNADGLPPHLHEMILDLENANEGLTLEVWGFPELLSEFVKLPEDRRRDWLGPAPASHHKPGFEDIQIVLKDIESKDTSAPESIRSVPQGKIEYNRLSESVRGLLVAGMAKVEVVSDFFHQWPDAEFGERVCKAFREEYRSLKSQKLHPNEIYGELQIWTGGEAVATPERQVAVLAVLAYFFDSCDIFEEPPNPS